MNKKTWIVIILVAVGAYLGGFEQSNRLISPSLWSSAQQNEFIQFCTNPKGNNLNLQSCTCMQHYFQSKYSADQYKQLVKTYSGKTNVQPLIESEKFCGVTSLSPFLVNPTPTVSFAQKQQCADDANIFMTRLNQKSDKDQQLSQLQGHTSISENSLKGSIYSSRLNTCVAEVNQNGTYDGQSFYFAEIFDTLTGKLLAQTDWEKNSTITFIPEKAPATSIDYLTYEESLGLSL